MSPIAAGSSPSRAWLLPTVEATGELGCALAQCLRWSQSDARVLYLHGELGAGKTTLTAAVFAALGVTETVRSPSFSLVEVYDTPLGQAVHLDLYRLSNPGEIEQLALRDYLVARTLLVIEWPERGTGALPPPDLEIELATQPRRMATVVGASSDGQRWLESLPEELLQSRLG